jgi:saccharopine dehydrogenase-like NADP-dependent oxidoreductase
MSRTKVAVLGGGLVGGYVARRLARTTWAAVRLWDAREDVVQEARRARVEAERADLTDPSALAAAFSDAEVVLGALPGRLGYDAVKAALEAGRDVVDISFFPEDPWPLDEVARSAGRTAIVDCGLMPGLGGMLGHHLAARLDAPSALEILVGGLPVERRWPTEYRAPFSPSDVIEEYTRPARIRRGGRVVERPALSEPELVDVPGLGTLEAALTDGLRSLLETLPLPDMEEKTLRYPGHFEKMRALRDLGFFDETPVDVGGREVSPLDLTSALLFEEWKQAEGEPELTVMRVVVTGEHRGRDAYHVAEVLDRGRPEVGESSMARTTGLPAIAVAEMVASGALSEPGLVPAEKLGADERALTAVLDLLASEDVSVTLDA